MSFKTQCKPCLEGDDLWRWLLWFTYFYLLIRTAWVSDDAFITARSIENFIHGYGPVYNIGERVQTFTHPLWFLLISAVYFFIVQVLHLDFHAQMFLTITGVSIFISLVTMYILLFKISDRSHLLFAIVPALLFTRTFLDYSTSGLETPLTFLLLSLWYYLIEFRKNLSIRDFKWLILLSALIMTNRLDIALVIIPGLIVLFWRLPLPLLKKIKITIINLWPLWTWEVFSLIYYGFPFPNTFYAKTFTQISRIKLILQGVVYIFNLWDFDPLSSLLLLTALGLGGIIFIKDKNMPKLSYIFGAALYISYIIYIGGDFMQGRFFAPLVLWSIFIWRHVPWPTKWNWHLLGFFLLWIAGQYFTVIQPQTTASTDLFPIPRSGIVDERMYYYTRRRALLQFSRFSPLPDSQYRGQSWIYEPNKREVFVVITAGTSGYSLGPNAHIVDVFALCDPLLARLPALHGSRIGHFYRYIPDGYLPSLVTKQNLIRDETVAAYYTYIDLIVHGPLFSKERWKAIWLLNTGQVSPPHRGYKVMPDEELSRFTFKE